MKRLVDGIITFVVIFFFSNGIGMLALPLIVKDLESAYISSVVLSLVVATILVIIDQARYLLKAVNKITNDEVILDDDILENVETVVEEQPKKETHESKT